MTDLNKALATENLSFPVWAILSSLKENGGACTVTELSLATGYSYWAVRNQIRRTPWFDVIVGSISTVIMSDLGKAKFERVTKLLTTPQ